MKKLLFTLCAVLAGLTVSAQSISFVYVDDEGTTLANNEVTVTPGVDKIVHVKITAMDTQISGLQFQYVMRDKDGVAHNEEWANVNIPSQKPAGATARARIRPEGMSTIVGNPFTNVMGKTEDELEEPAYRVVSANTTYNLCWVTDQQIALSAVRAAEHDNSIQLDELPDFGFEDAMFQLGNVYNFTIRTSETWDEEYATLDMDDAYSKFSIHASVGGGNVQPNGALDLKIKNANWQAPLEDLTGTVTFTVDEETGKVSVNYSGDEDVDIKVMYNGEEVEMPYQLTSGAEPIKLTYEVTAEGYNPLTGESQDLSWTEPAPAQTDKPTMRDYADVAGTVYVEAKGNEGEHIILNGPNGETVEGTTVATATVTYDPYVGYTGTWTATAQAEGHPVSETATYTVTIDALNPPIIAEPEITFVPTLTDDGTQVAYVEVNITNYTSYTINGQRTIVRRINANYEAEQEIVVNAVNAPIENHPEFKAEATATYTLNKLNKKAVPAPEVTPQTGDDAVTLNITWPESDGTHVIKVNGEESTETSFPRQDADYNVTLDIYVTEGPTCAESTHYTQTITIPKKVTTPTEQTGSPVFVNSPYTKPNVNAYFAQLENSEPGATIYYQVTDPDGNTTGWLEYTPGQEIACYGANGGGKDGNYTIEAYAVVTGKDPSKHISLSFQVGPTTGIDELIGGKAIANVRYFNMAGQEMQEANGMTIVVTTYTDGTTSAVKVMK